MDKRSELLKLIVERCCGNLAGNDKAKLYLSANGLSNEAVWSAYRVGVGDAGLVESLNDEQRGTLDALGLLPRKGPVFRDGGVILPTFNPEYPSLPVGLLKQNYGQNKHGFATPACGVACCADVNEYKRVIVADAPLLGLRLAQAGCKGVVIAECADVLPALKSWLLNREIVVASYKTAPLAEFAKAIGGKVETARIHTILEESNKQTLELLGIGQAPETKALSVNEAVAEGENEAFSEIVQSPAESVPVVIDSVPVSDEVPARLELLSHDVRSMRAKFRAGAVNYEIETALDCGSKFEVRIENEGLLHLDRFDVSKAAQRKRFSESAAIKTKTPFENIEADLIRLLDAVRGLQEELLNPSAKKSVSIAAVGDSEKNSARELLSKPDVLDRIAADLETLGWTGEDKNKRLLYLCAVSRLLSLPVSAALRAPASAGKSCAIETICLLTPPEDVVHISRASAAAFHLHPDLRHKLVVIDEADALSPEVIVALRVLQSRGALSQSIVERDGMTGKAITRVGETKGPVSVLTSTTQEMDAEFIARCYDLSVDTSAAQTQRILEAQRKLRADPDRQGSESLRSAIIKRHHALQRLLSLERRTVVIPFSDRIEFPSNAVQHRREQQKLLSLIEASALLHSANRLKERNRSGEEVVIADQRDFEIAVQLVSGLIQRASDELPRHAWDVLEAVRSAGLSSFTLAEVKAKYPDWTRHKIYAGLEALARLEIVTCSRGRGKVRQYSVQSNRTELESVAVRLRPVGELSKLSNSLDNNFTPVRAIG